MIRFEEEVLWPQESERRLNLLRAVTFDCFLMASFECLLSWEAQYMLVQKFLHLSKVVISNKLSVLEGAAKKIE